jgi:hypothetical protein
MRVLVLGVVLSCLSPMVATAADPPAAWQSLLDDWQQAKAKADAGLVRAIDQKVAALKKDRTQPAEIRNEFIEVFQEQKQRFVSSGELPEGDYLLPASLAYLDSLHKASQPVRAKFEKQLEAAVGTGDQFDSIQAAKQKWETDLPGRGEFAARTEYHGTVALPDRTTDLHLHVTHFEDSVSLCDVWRDLGDAGQKRGWQFGGKLDGNELTLVSTKMLHGPPNSLMLRGYIVGKRLIMTVTLSNGKPPQKQPTLISLWKK